MRRGEFTEEIYVEPETEDGKTIEQEGRDSARMIGCVLAWALASYFGGLLAFIAWSLLGRPWPA